MSLAVGGMPTRIYQSGDCEAAVCERQEGELLGFGNVWPDSLRHILKQAQTNGTDDSARHFPCLTLGYARNADFVNKEDTNAAGNGSCNPKRIVSPTVILDPSPSALLTTLD